MEDDADVVKGTLPISGHLAKVLIDPGSTNSFIRLGFIKRIRFRTEILSYLIEVSTPTGENRIETEKICKNCDVEIGERKFPTNLISLGINGYDVILIGLASPVLCAVKL